jgi:hypothetical protein
MQNSGHNETTSSLPIAGVIEERERLRYKVLAAAYDLSNGEERRLVTLNQLVQKTAQSADRLKSALRYLWGEGLLAEQGNGYTSAITHAGIVEFEQSVKEPEKPTPHFRVAVIQVFNSAVGAVQTGEGSAAGVMQQVGESTKPK